MQFNQPVYSIPCRTINCSRPSKYALYAANEPLTVAEHICEECAKTLIKSAPPELIEVLADHLAEGAPEEDSGAVTDPAAVVAALPDDALPLLMERLTQAGYAVFGPSELESLGAKEPSFINGTAQDAQTEPTQAELTLPEEDVKPSTTEEHTTAYDGPGADPIAPSPPVAAETAPKRTRSKKQEG